MPVMEHARTPQVEFSIWEGTADSWRSEWDSWEFFMALWGRAPSRTVRERATRLKQARACGSR